MSSNGNIFCVTGPLWGESTNDWWIHLTKVSDVEPVIGEAIGLTMIESIKTTSMENVSTGVLEKIKNII